MRDIVPVAKSVQTVRMAEIHLKYFETKRNWKPEVIWCYGPTGSGKSKYAHETAEDAFVALETGQWWEGYDQHEDVIIDDMRKDFVKFHTLLKLLDRYPFVIECKGGSRQFLAKRIFITTPLHPLELYDTREDVKQLTRRIDKCLKFTDIEKPPEQVDANVNEYQVRWGS